MILEETLAELRAGGELTGRSVRAVYPTPYFAVVELDDGSIGAGMSYYRGPAEETEPLGRRIEGFREADPLLIHWLFEEPRPWLRVGREGEDGRRLIWALQTALLSALSDRRLRAGGDDAFVAVSKFPADLFAECRRALVIGFGGYMNYFVRVGHVGHLHVCDLFYQARRAEMEQYADRYRRERPDFQFTLSDGSDIDRRMREADVVTITGSALCNGTLEGLLERARGGPRVVVVQGESAGIYPSALFRRGVAMTATTLKPPELARRAAADPSGDQLRPLLEGGIPWTYFLAPAATRPGKD